jgi:tRNA nucleotidyltransferase (CCA-adding enzyme)
MNAESCPQWRHFSHAADIGVEGIGDTLEEAFCQAAIALTAVVSDPLGVTAKERVDVECYAPDIELLFVDWLNSVIYEMATRRMLFSRFNVHISGEHLRAEAWGESIDRARHEPAVEVKGASYTALSVYRDELGCWHAQCIVDV